MVWFGWQDGWTGYLTCLKGVNEQRGFDCKRGGGNQDVCVWKWDSGLKYNTGQRSTATGQGQGREEDSNT